MKLVAALLNSATAVAIFVATNAPAFQAEGNFQPSPSGQFVLSVVNHQVAIPIPTEGLELSASVAVRVRNSKGKELFTVPVAKARQSHQIGHGRVSAAWSLDSKMLAYCNQGNLSVVDVASKKTRKLLERVSSFRWVGTSNLCCISGPSGRGGQLCVNEIPSNGEVGVSRTFDFKLQGFESIASEECRELSPDSQHLVFMDGAQIRVQSLKGTTNQAVLQRKLYPGGCWWTDSGDKCLLAGLETVKTTKAWPEDTTSRNAVYLYETKSASLRDISELLRQLNPTNYLNPMPSVESHVWSPQGNWFLVAGPGDWVCIPEPWRLRPSASPNCRHAALGTPTSLSASGASQHLSRSGQGFLAGQCMAQAATA